MNYYYWWTEFAYAQYAYDKPRFGPITVFRQPDQNKMIKRNREYLINGAWIAYPSIADRYCYHSYREAMAAFYKAEPDKKCLNFDTEQQKGSNV